jgi:polyhydroxybutyrate depolymerase
VKYSLLAAVGLAACWSAPKPTAIDAPATVADTRPPAVCGLRSGMRGQTSRSVIAGGLARTYLVYLPATVAPATPVPLVIVAHGYSMSGQAMADITQYAALADAEHIAVAFPDGQAGPNSFGAPWNVGAGVCPAAGNTAPPVAAGDDFALLDAIEADIANDQCLDPAHKFITGFSMGGYFSHQVNCMRADYRAAAPHSGGTHDLATCTVGHKPIIIFHGSADAAIPAGCDDPDALGVLGVTPSATAWAAHNGCATTTTTRAITNGSCIDFDGCPADGQVTLCRFDVMGHCWAGGPASAGVFACPGYAGATQLEWDFWKQHAW